MDFPQSQSPSSALQLCSFSWHTAVLLIMFNCKPHWLLYWLCIMNICFSEVCLSSLLFTWRTCVVYFDQRMHAQKKFVGQQLGVTPKSLLTPKRLHEPLVCMMKKVLFPWFLNVFDHFRPCEHMRKHAFAGWNTQQWNEWEIWIFTQWSNINRFLPQWFHWKLFYDQRFLKIFDSDQSFFSLNKSLNLFEMLMFHKNLSEIVPL